MDDPMPRANPVVLKPLSLYNGPLGGWTVSALYSWAQHEQKKRNYYTKKTAFRKGEIEATGEDANESDVHKRQRLEKIRSTSRTINSGRGSHSIEKTHRPVGVANAGVVQPDRAETPSRRAGPVRGACPCSQF
ncbi:hypothetical protein EVAR_7206_1 [Eumeta japonica]|uniref:Uncharacterized protein n=1 Tax=Eumeta variegata TaxID=151549 RepID=A0A4C1T267_EUMVA|nr:hypothetical protein EVAR_7206_1 [Eumeta japonica]